MAALLLLRMAMAKLLLTILDLFVRSEKVLVLNLEQFYSYLSSFCL
ncbi:unnamed protein product [Paramecium octaurelia]|uniref:Uncharacterized protein n=1 Tax=Paramecium octaurelia TaxID=43137 RepID=A0A8S1WQZ1_PAROT|nr:unnamed protein product [Paramecium octaurelia]